ncbi:hypothetical protein KGF56_003143 [Candida oxycetoniae]|uniref:Ubiquitin-like domain-containing protein n=1 Tax=Candida oxycetoniae TaxID=497107 RepID=A0AAI9WXC9_9ASCO|nr:uncharacterized protein KGF56_003143 [Candida oxycetoniae]KAI3404107.2 hypothetical protein KGF56_003143 [Candida oxycetoniae]
MDKSFVTTYIELINLGPDAGPRHASVTSLGPSLPKLPTLSTVLVKSIKPPHVFSMPVTVPEASSVYVLKKALAEKVSVPWENITLMSGTKVLSDTMTVPGTVIAMIKTKSHH